MNNESILLKLDIKTIKCLMNLLAEKIAGCYFVLNTKQVKYAEKLESVIETNTKYYDYLNRHLPHSQKITLNATINAINKKRRRYDKAK